jgi:reverse gyrase
MNKRIMKAVREGKEFRADWLRAQRYKRLNYVDRELGFELEAELIQQWINARKMWV